MKEYTCEFCGAGLSADSEIYSDKYGNPFACEWEVDYGM